MMLLLAIYQLIKKEKFSFYSPSAVIAISMSTIVYWSLYNPLTMESSNLFLHLSAGLPTYFVALVTYYLSAKYVFKFAVDHSTALPKIQPTEEH